MPHHISLLKNQEEVLKHGERKKAQKTVVLQQKIKQICKKCQDASFQSRRLPQRKCSYQAISSWVMVSNYHRRCQSPIIQWWVLGGTFGFVISGGDCRGSSWAQKFGSIGWGRGWVGNAYHSDWWCQYSNLENVQEISNVVVFLATGLYSMN